MPCADVAVAIEPYQQRFIARDRHGEITKDIDWSHDAFDLAGNEIVSGEPFDDLHASVLEKVPRNIARGKECLSNKASDFKSFVEQMSSERSDVALADKFHNHVHDR